MPALWPAFITTVGTYLDTKIPKTEDSTAGFIANAYRVAIITSTIPAIPGSFILATPSQSGIKKGLLEAFNKCKETNNIQQSHFNLLSSELMLFWDNVEWSPTPPPTGYVGPDPSSLPFIKPGININFLGETSLLSASLNNVFSPPPISGPGGVLFATRLSNMFQSHLYSMSGIYKGLVPSVTGPVPGPTFPWAIIT